MAKKWNQNPGMIPINLKSELFKTPFIQEWKLYDKTGQQKEENVPFTHSQSKRCQLSTILMVCYFQITWESWLAICVDFILHFVVKLKDFVDDHSEGNSSWRLSCQQSKKRMWSGSAELQAVSPDFHRFKVDLLWVSFAIVCVHQRQRGGGNAFHLQVCQELL